MSDDNQSDTVEDMPALPTGSGGGPHPSDVDLAGLTHTGRVRPDNQDHFHVVQFGRYLRTLVSSLPAGQAAEELDRMGYGYIVADGIGGHAGGETASRLAIGVLIEFGLNTPDWILGWDDDCLTRVMDRFAQRFRDVNETILAEAADRPELKGMGTTLSVAITLGDDLLVTHVGDSPVCLFRQGRLHRLTRDHSAQQLRPDADAPRMIRFRKVLTRAVGISTAAGEPDLYHYKLADGDRLLLCTDGLTDMADDETIARELGRETPAADACRALVDLALDRGGRDNVTVVVANYRFPPTDA